MGYIFHDAIVVTVQGSGANRVHDKAREIFATLNARPNYGNGAQLVSPLADSATNAFTSFAVFPDGSKEGWALSDEVDMCRSELVAFLRAECVDFVHVRFGGDGGGEGLTAVVAHGDQGDSYLGEEQQMDTTPTIAKAATAAQEPAA